ncbi:MAG: GrxC family glutaredoxin [Gammaproteobacteria bacterium]|jgi:GrxC family glutaredoxin
MTTVEIYTKSWCGFCRMAKAILIDENITFEEIDVTFDNDKELEMIERSGRRTVPQIFINNEPIGGYTDLMQLSSTINLRDLLTGKDEQSE